MSEPSLIDDLKFLQSTEFNEMIGDVREKLKNRLQYLKEQNARMDEILKKLRLANDLQKDDLQKHVEELDIIMEVTVTVSPDNMPLSKAIKLRKTNNYVSKLRMCIRYYINQNESLANKIKALKGEVNFSKESVDNITRSSQDIQQLAEKAKQYEKELIKFQKKYPWLKNPEFDLVNIKKYTDKLDALRKEKEVLTNELSVYQNLKPDIRKAKEQLAKVKEEFKQFNV